MREDEERLVFGLLRIYRNHLGINDYGDCDDLTGLLDRRVFEETFHARWSRQNSGARRRRSDPCAPATRRAARISR